MWRRILTVCLLGLPAIAGAQTVDVPAAAMRDSGIKIVSLAPKIFAPARTGYGLVENPAPVIGLRARLLAAAVREQLTQEEMRRTVLLYRTGRNVSAASLEQAKSAQAVAAGRVAALKAKSVATFGTALAAAMTKSSGPEAALAGGAASLVEVSLLGSGLRSPPLHATARAEAGGRFSLTLIGSAGHVPRGVAGQGIYYLGPALPSGLSLDVRLPAGPATAGYILPRSALIYRPHGRAVFVRTGPTRFVLHPLPAMAAVRRHGMLRGYFVPEAALPHGGPVVIGGAGLLLSIMTRAPGGK